MAHPLDVMLRQYVAPVLKEAGYGKAGRTYRLAADNGDYALFNAYTTENVAPTMLGFGARFVLAPRSIVAWHRRDSADPFAKPAGMENALVMVELIAPDEQSFPMPYEQMFGNNWRFDLADDGRACGEALRADLVEVIPLIDRLLDRTALLEEIRHPSLRSIPQPDLDTPYPGVWTVVNIHPRASAEILLLLEDGPIQEVERLLPASERDSPSGQFGDWVREQLAQRSRV